ncbi:MAG: PQQ-binding-like beta-propeller repeat protein [Melioribacteraceae bacterium]|nr:PQQ-binding-like beta-propeller repeat protein [Melioribacteraceae bacterium]
MNRFKNISIIFLLSSFLFSFIISCDSTDPKPPEKPPGYQEDIYWPSLADSPWPIYRGDPQNTSRSSYGPITGNLTWEIDSITVWSGITIDSENNIYFVGQSGLYSYDEVGNLRWLLNFSPGTAGDNPTPLLLKEGVIITASRQEIVGADLDGNLLWTIPITFCWSNSFTVSKSGSIYCNVFRNSGSSLLEITAEGNIIWELTPSIFTDFLENLVFSPDSKTIYGSSYNQEDLIAFDIESKSIKWKYPAQSRYAPSVDNSGNLYFQSYDENFNMFVTVLNEDGELLWEQNVGKDEFNIHYYGVCIDYFGNIYSGYIDEEYPTGAVISFKQDGSVNWIVSAFGLRGRITSDRNGNIYISRYSGFDEVTLESFSKEGENNWELSFTYTSASFPAPLVINSNSALYLAQKYYRAGVKKFN